MRRFTICNDGGPSTRRVLLEQFHEGPARLIVELVDKETCHASITAVLSPTELRELAAAAVVLAEVAAP